MVEVVLIAMIEKEEVVAMAIFHTLIVLQTLLATLNFLRSRKITEAFQMH